MTIENEPVAANRSVGVRGKDLIKSYETLSLVAYKPTPEDVWTIGYGSTRGVRQGQHITLAQAMDRLVMDLQVAETDIKRALLGVPLTQSMYDALVSLVFNVGGSCLADSSTIGGALRVRDYYKAWRGFALWTKQGKKDLLGLARRRAQEMALFLEDKF